MHKGTFTVSTSKQLEFLDITAAVQRETAVAGDYDGICYLYNPHTTAGLTINEGADPAVRDDILAVLRGLVPQSPSFKHMEGNSPAHVMASLMGCSVTVFIERGKLQLGTWQSIFFCEFDGPRTRKIHWRLV